MKISTVALITLALSLQAGPGFAQGAGSSGATGAGANQGTAGTAAGGATSNSSGQSGATGTGAGTNDQEVVPKGKSGTTGQQPKTGTSKSQNGGTPKQNQQGETGQGGMKPAEGQSGQTKQGETKGGELRKGERKGATKAGETKQGEPRHDQAGQGNGKPGTVGKENAGQGTAHQAHSRPVIKTEQQTRIRETFKTLNVRPVTDLNVRIAVGVAIPRTVELRPLPPAIIEIVPELRDFRYVLVPGRILIVDPASLEIVEIIEI